jgi:hypothetical protein
MVKKALPQIRSHPFAQPGHQIKPRGGGDGQGGDQSTHHQRGAVQGAVPAGEAIINQVLEPLPKRKRQPRRQQQRRNRGQDARQLWPQ